MRALLVPIKAFSQAKARLSSVLDARERNELARELAAIVLAAGRGLDRFVVCDDEQVAEWAGIAGATVLWTPGLGLSGAVEFGVEHLGSLGVTLAVVAHADLPLVVSFDDYGSEDMVTISPDHRFDGTNVLAVPPKSGFHFGYGPASFARHRREAERCALRCRNVFDWRLACDVDLPEDLHHVRTLSPADAGTVKGAK